MSLNSSIPTQPKLMTSTELHAMIARMDSYGGSFVSSIAQALRFADPTNRQRLLDAFPDLVQQYGPEGRFAQAKQLTKV
jgi:2-oxo-4-hydroxy-4-carboxy--5-ureidoimidazoline (OHCU) decarboxylase